MEGIPERVLAIYAHPDDAEVSCGATLAKWRSGGAEICLVVATKGEKGTQDPSADPAAFAKEREAEMRLANAHLGIEGRTLLGIADGEVSNTTELREALVRIIRRETPTVVLCSDPTAVFFGNEYYNHRDHRELGWATLDAISPSAGSPHYFPDCGTPHQVELVYMSGTKEPDVVVDVTSHLGAKIAAIASHSSQIGSAAENLESQVRAGAEAVGKPSGYRYGESFRVLRVAASHG